jgi:4-hydroxy-3-methylbut-2-enyl diphosphate reductase
LGKHPFDEKIEGLNVGDIVEVEIVKILPFGAIAKTESGLEGLIHISEVTAKTFVKNVHEVCKVGERKTALIKEIDLERKKVGFSLKALEEAEGEAGDK